MKEAIILGEEIRTSLMFLIKEKPSLQTFFLLIIKQLQKIAILHGA